MKYILLAALGLWTVSACAQTIAPLNTVYYSDWHARAKDYLFRTYTDPMRMAWLLVDSAKDTVWKDPVAWDRSPESYSCRVASGLGRRIVRNSLQLAFESTLREDSRYRISAEHGFRKRAWFAMSHSVLAYRPDGAVEPAFGRMGAGLATAAISSTWHPASTTAGALAGGIAESALDRAGNNLLTEFEPDLIQFGKRTWKNLTGK